MFNRNEDELKENIRKIGELDDAKKKEIYNETTNLIEYFERMSSEMEKRKESIYNQAVTKISLLLAFIAVVIGLQQKNSDLFLYFSPIYVFCAGSIANSIIICNAYWKQSQSKYVFKDQRLQKYGNYWKRFYYGNQFILNIDATTENNKNGSGENLKSKYNDKSVMAYLQGLNYEILQFSSEKQTEMTINNIAHFYMLQVHNYYKNRQHMELVEINKRYNKYIIICTLACVIFNIFIYYVIL